MNVVNPSVEVWPVDSTDPKAVMRHIERAGRVCYKSEDRITDESCEKFIESVLMRDHTAVIEHGNLIVYATGDTETYVNFIRDTFDGFSNFFRVTRVADFQRQVFKGVYASANMRTWREVIRIGLMGNLWIPPALEAVLGQYGLLFEDLLNMNRHDKPGWERPAYNPQECYVVDQRNLPVDARTIHGTFTVKFTCDRGVSHEIVRHRMASYCQESTRYCNYSADKFGNNITVIKPCYWAEDSVAYKVWESACEAAEVMYFKLLELKATPQEARAVLPNSLKTELVMTARANEWLWFFNLRTAEAAHPQMREVAKMAYGLLICADPEIFGRSLQ